MDNTAVIIDGPVALINKIGPAIVVTHSQSVTFGRRQSAMRDAAAAAGVPALDLLPVFGAANADFGLPAL